MMRQARPCSQQADGTSDVSIWMQPQSETCPVSYVVLKKHGLKTRNLTDSRIKILKKLPKQTTSFGH